MGFHPQRDESLHFNGRLDPNSSCGKGIITEHVVSIVLGDCEKCSGISLRHPYDLVSERYGKVDVKSNRAGGHKDVMSWIFEKSRIVPDHYICVGFDRSRSQIEHVWIIPGTANVGAAKKIYVSQKTLDKLHDYEVDKKPYNHAYKAVKIEDFPEFNQFGDDVVKLESIAKIRISTRVPQELYDFAVSQSDTISESVVKALQFWKDSIENDGNDQLEKTQVAEPTFQMQEPEPMPVHVIPGPEYAIVEHVDDLRRQLEAKDAQITRLNSTIEKLGEIVYVQIKAMRLDYRPKRHWWEIWK